MFQKRIVEKYSAKLNKTIIDEKYDLFRSIFANPEKQENIRNSKEEQYQEGFLRDLFVSVLGYTINPEPNYNLLTEQKNISKGNDNRKADGAVIFDNKVKVVIELKGTDTTDLNKIESQAFLYKEHNPECKYVVISNFERLRFYVENAIEFEEFNLFNLSRNEFQMLYLCLEINQIKNDIPLQLKHETVSQEKEITDSFYGDYSVFKRNLFEDIYTNNPDYDKLLLFKKTQKLLDRILFILFCEDRELLPVNSVNNIIKQWEQLKDLDAYQPLYSRFQNFFNRINEGYTSPKNPSDNIFAYNGGLFKPDEILDNIKIGDDVLFLYSKRLSDYDFDSQISVDILGHIFEHSLTEIEEIQKQIEAEKSGLTTEKTDIGKRKKDGVFYTPSYITKYIVENTIGKLCNEKKEELGIKDSAFSKSKKTAKEKDELNKKLEEYKEWLLSLKILDPACGSGAFLNAALKQLKIEHTLIDYYRAKIYGDSMIFQDVENDILEKNIFGVDINDESVEIAKLSLWLHTAQKNRKLTTLNNNIKCGNSLIDDSEVAGEKAFNWQKEFPEVFEKGGFDVVIGNPPYVNMANIQNENERKFYQNNYKTVKNKCDLYSIFTEKAQSLLKQEGLFGFIFSNSWMGTESFSLFRDFLAHDVQVKKLVQLPPDVFQDATVTTCICLYTNTKPTENDFIEIETCIDQKFVSKGFTLPYKQILENPNTSFSFEKTISLDKIHTIPLGEIASFSLGIKTSDDKRFIFQEKKDDDCFLFLRGRNISRWCVPENNEWLWYKPELITQKAGGRPRIFENFTVDKKIVIQDMAFEINASMDYKHYLCNDKVNIIFETNTNYSMEYILCLLNSTLVNIWFKKIYTSGLEIKINQLKTIPIPEITPEQQKPFIELAEKMLNLNADLQKLSSKFIGRLKESLGVEKITSTLEEFFNYDFETLVKDLSKQKIKLSLKQKDEWEDYFTDYKNEITGINQQIEATDKEINSLVYKLYELTPEEIQTIENVE